MGARIVAGRIHRRRIEVEVVTIRSRRGNRRPRDAVCPDKARLMEARKREAGATKERGMTTSVL